MIEVFCIYCKNSFQREVVRGRNKNGFVCPRCHNIFRKKKECCNCKKQFIINDLKNYGDIVLCGNCLSNRNRNCVVCGEISESYGKKYKEEHICNKCYKKDYKTPEELCCRCGDLRNVFKRAEEGVVCAKCYQAEYNAPTQKCCVCFEEKPTHKHTNNGPICKFCYKKTYKPPKRKCSVCEKTKIIVKKLNESDGLCQSCYVTWRCQFDDEFAVRTRIRKKISKVLRSLKHRVGAKINYADISKYLGPCPGKLDDYHIDHILPLSAFDLMNEVHFAAAFAPENHQWLEKSENMSKKATHDPEELKKYLNKFR